MLTALFHTSWVSTVGIKVRTNVTGNWKMEENGKQIRGWNLFAKVKFNDYNVLNVFNWRIHKKNLFILKILNSQSFLCSGLWMDPLEWWVDFLQYNMWKRLSEEDKKHHLWRKEWWREMQTLRRMQRRTHRRLQPLHRKQRRTDFYRTLS